MTRAVFIRHFGRAVGENWQMHRVSDRAGWRPRATEGEAVRPR
jgi:hypothetical protein